jgi:phosphatidylinositol alpha-mannosyltransferase
MQGTFIGVLMSSTLPARLGEPSRALIVARRLGRARETLPVVLGTMVSQTLLNLLALIGIGAFVFSGIDPLDGRHGVLVAAAIAPALALLVALLAPALSPAAGTSGKARREAILAGGRQSLARLRDGLRLFTHPRHALGATALQFVAWGLQLLSCWLLLMALGISSQVGVAGAAAVLFAVNATALLPATPGNVGLFQAACVAVLAGAYHVSTPEALAYGIVLQAVEIATALLMGTPALVNEGLTWREVRLRTIHASPVKLGPLPGAAALGAAARAER